MTPPLELETLLTPCLSCMNIIFETNAAGAYATVEAFKCLLRKLSVPRIIDVASGAASLGCCVEVNTPSYKVK